jgi:hypothetical protein
MPLKEKSQGCPCPDGGVTEKNTVAILIYFLLLCIKEMPIIGTTIIPNPQSPNHTGLSASVSTIRKIIFLSNFYIQSKNTDLPHQDHSEEHLHPIQTILSKTA